MQYCNSTEQRLDFIVEKFRPLLQKINFKDLPKQPQCLSLSNPLNIMESRFKIIVLRDKVSDGQDGYFLFRSKQNGKLFVLTIVINEDLFISDEQTLRVQRKAVGVHEYVHCVAAIRAFSRLTPTSKELLEGLEKEIKEKVKVYTSVDFNKLFDSIGLTAKRDEVPDAYPDSHFRLDYEEVEVDYSDLYYRFLFAYQLYLETFGENIVKFFSKKTKAPEKKEILALIKTQLDELVINKALNEKFAARKFNYFTQRYHEENNL